MNAMTPTETERSILEFMCDPERPKQLLAQVQAAEKAEVKARAAQAEADAAYKLAADELTKAREVQDINTKKSAALRDQANALAQVGEDMKAAKADDVARLAEWENRLKAQQADLDTKNENLLINLQAAGRRATEFEAELAAAQAIIDRAERIKAASEA